jgi:hypothetical protein
MTVWLTRVPRVAPKMARRNVESKEANPGRFHKSREISGRFHKSPWIVKSREIYEPHRLVHGVCVHKPSKQLSQYAAWYGVAVKRFIGGSLIKDS